MHKYDSEEKYHSEYVAHRVQHIAGMLRYDVTIILMTSYYDVII